jgi:hypothetical protein
MNALIDLDQGMGNVDALEAEEQKAAARATGGTGHTEDWDKIDENIHAKFEMVQKMGKGNYGTVWKAINKLNRERIAIKKI